VGQQIKEDIPVIKGGILKAFNQKTGPLSAQGFRNKSLRGPGGHMVLIGFKHGKLISLGRISINTLSGV
jgi:hypothetical protein